MAGEEQGGLRAGRDTRSVTGAVLGTSRTRYLPLTFMKSLGTCNGLKYIRQCYDVPFKR